MVKPIRMPTALERLAQAREVYLSRVDESHDTENVRESYDYNNALLLYLYGYWPQAKSRFARIFEQHCAGVEANETGRVAWFNLNNMAVAMNETEEVERLSRNLQERQCTFASGAVAGAPIDCSKEENKDEPQCVATVQLSNIRYQKAVQIFDDAEKSSGDEQRKLFEKAAALLVEAVNDEPEHPQAPLALEKPSHLSEPAVLSQLRACMLALSMRSDLAKQR
ncbi:MAG: hypothetical protein IPJ88_13675 [Myxococcales bacterium]|nr:MAG: hypothetical protein IPJ88_13675 [Myxococcales bacterium]